MMDFSFSRSDILSPLITITFLFGDDCRTWHKVKHERNKVRKIIFLNYSSK